MAEVLRGVRTGQGLLSASPAGGTIQPTADTARRVEAPYLQLVMERLWQIEREEGSTLLRRETLQSLGGPERAVRSRFIGLMDSLSVPDRTLADRLLNFHVTPSRTKIAWQVSDLAHYAEAPVVRARELLQRLAGPDFRILRRVERHAGDRQDVVVLEELYHDILADGILGWLGERKRRGKRIVICCDGTWSREDNAYITNVRS